MNGAKVHPLSLLRRRQKKQVMRIVKVRSNKIAEAVDRLPASSTAVTVVSDLTRSPMTKRQVAGAIFNWMQCILMLVLMLSQLLTVVWSDSSASKTGVYGRNPELGNYAISGYNDEPYSDRMLLCLRRGRRFGVLSVNEALAARSTIVESTDGTAVNGYRVVTRTGLATEQNTRTAYAKTCSLINSTLEYMYSVCDSLGYTNLTRDGLRIVDGVYSTTVSRIPGSLPVIIMPYWDNGLGSRYAIPGWDGHACMFRLTGLYQEVLMKNAYLYTVNRTVRESKTIEWLQKPGGKWKHGWYEDMDGQRWYTDVVSTNPENSNGLTARWFDMQAQRELNCSHPGECTQQIISSHWGKSLLITLKLQWLNSVAIANGYRYGLFYYEYKGQNIVTCVYDMATFISDASVVLLLVQWMMSMYALQRGYWKGITPWHNAGIGCLANSYSFNTLPLAMLPRLKTILAAFHTIGCEFEGEQKALGDSWFVMYPAIVEIVLIFSSLLNFVTKVFRRRMRGWMIATTIILLSAMHYLRAHIGESKRFGFDGRLSTVVGSDEYDALSLSTFFTLSGALRMNGNVWSLLVMKLAILLLNVLPLLFSKNMSLKCKQSISHRCCGIEKALSVRACNVGGIGLSRMYESFNTRSGGDQDHQIVAMNAYELVRLGFVVVGDRYLMSWDNWIIMTSAAPLQGIYALWNHRILVFRVHRSKGNTDCPTFWVSLQPDLLRVNDPKLQSIRFWDIDARPIE